MFAAQQFRPGDLVVYRKTKHAATPGPRAERISPAPHGDTYSYVVDKFWIVDRICEDGVLMLRTRRGKTHKTSSDDPSLRHAGLITRLLYGHRFPGPEAESQRQQQPQQQQPTAST
jgi:hypothetical protein